MTTRHPRAVPWILPAIAACLTSLAPLQAQAQDDYALASTSWNGLSDIGTAARTLGIEVVELESLDLATVGPTTPLLVLYPRNELPSEDLLRFLRAGGRLAVADDFGAGGRVLERLGVRRAEGPVVSPPAAINDNANLPIAVPRQSHPLNAGVDQLVTNHPAALASPLPPVFDFGSEDRSVVVAGAIGSGRVVLISDPSVLINNMLQFPGNRRFAENLLRYLAAAPGSRILLLRGDFAMQGTVVGADEGGIDRGAGEFFTAFNAFLSGMGAPTMGEPLLRGAGAMLAAACILALLLTVPLRGRLYDGRWLHPAARPTRAGFAGKVQLFRERGVNYLMPALIYRRELEASLVHHLGLHPPAPIADVERAMRKRGSAAVAADLRKLIELLDGLAMRESQGLAPHVDEARMADLFARGSRLLGVARQEPPSQSVKS